MNKKRNKAPASLEPLPSRFMRIFKQKIFRKIGAGIRTQALKVQGALKEINWKSENTMRWDRTRASKDQGASKGETLRFGAGNPSQTRRWRTVVSTTFSGQPGGAPPWQNAEFYEIYMDRKVFS